MGTSSLSIQGDCRGLSDKQRKFVVEYAIDYNATRAAKAAKYAHPHVAGRKLLKNKKVAAALARIQSRNLKEATLSKQEIISELCSIAMRDPLDMCDEDGKFITDDLSKIPAHFRRAIDGLRIKQTIDPETGAMRQEFEVKLVGKATAFRMLMEHFGLFAAQEHKHEHTINWEQLFNESPADHDVIDAEIKNVRIQNQKLLSE